MEERAQVAVEYLLTVLFAVVLVIAVTVIAFQVSVLSSEAQRNVLANRDEAIQTLQQTQG